MFKNFIIALALCGPLGAISPDRITRPVDTRVTAPARTPVPKQAKPQYDQGAVDPSFRMDYLMLMVKPSQAQQTDLKTLLANQQNPSSAQFHKWLTPEQFGDRFGLNPSDHSKLLAWLQSEGLTIHESARARNWIAFGGTAGQVQHALHTAIHRYRVNGEMHFANAVEPGVPEALAEVVGGFIGLHDFNPQPSPKTVKPDFNVGANHFLAPEDWATIYDVAPLYAAGIDGTGVNIGIIGGSQLTLSDIQTFRSNYNLPAKDPVTVLVGNNPGLVPNAMTEADLDIEWAGAVAPNATIYFYYAANNLNTAIAAAINANVVQIISMSFGTSEFDSVAVMQQPIFQQANAQGITMIAATGDSGAATAPDSATEATKGPVVSSPASYPEATAVGGTQFNEGTGTYWASANSPNSGSALSYIPEIAWSGGGGGASAIFFKPDWQAAPGVPADGARDLPDVALSASGHDSYYIVTSGRSVAVAGTSASAPSMAGIVALLNQYLVAHGSLSQPGLGNINPQLYRLAQTAPTAFHDITVGSNAVPCEQGSPDCQGTFGYSAGPGYDQATGLGSIDANVFVTSWSNAASPVTVTLTAAPAQATLNDTFQLTATVTPVSGAGTPTGTVDFGTQAIPLGSVMLDASSGQPTAIMNVPGYLLGSANTFLLSAQYRGDAAFSGGGASTSVSLTVPTGVSSIVPSAPLSVSAQPDASGLAWQVSLTLREMGGVAASLAGFTIDGQDQPVAQYFPRAAIPAGGALNSQPIVFHNLATPLVRTFGFSGTDSTGQNWSRQLSITFLGPRDVHQVLMTGVPLTVVQDPTAMCQWPQQVILSEQGGFPETISGLSMGSVSMDSQVNEVFGTSRLAAYRSLQGNLCWSNATPGTSNTVKVTFASGISQTLTVSFAAPAANPAPVSVAPASVTLSAAVAAPPVQGNVAVTAPDGQSWSASVFPQNLFTRWLTLSQSSGSGSAQITLQADPTGLENGVYLATVVIQGPNLSPPAITVPVVFVYGDSSIMTITSFTNSASGQSAAAPGMIATMTGTALANRTVQSNAATFTYSVNGVPSGFGLTVNGIPAAFKSISPTRIDFQIPYETGTGPAVVGVNNNGSLNGFLFNVAPAAPGIYPPPVSVKAGSPITLTMTGDGVTNPALNDGANPPGNNLTYKTALPFTLTIAGMPVSLTSYGIAQGDVGVTTMNFIVPASVPAGPQPVVVTVDGIASPTVTMNVTAGP